MVSCRSVPSDMLMFNYFAGCELKEGKEVTFNPEDDDFEHQLSVRMVRAWSSRGFLYSICTTV